MKYFYDTEFIEDGKTIELISIGIVCEDGREFYAESNECDIDLASDWVKENVIPHLTQGYDAKVHKSRDEIRDALIGFVGSDKPEWWGYYSAYDHVALCQLFGMMIDLPTNWPYYTNDIKQLCVSLGDPKLPMQEDVEHNALADARWNKKMYDFLKG